MCQLFGVTRQSYYQYYWQQETTSFEEELIIREVLRIRQVHRRMGGGKLYELLEPFMLEHQIKMGRDALFNVLATHNLLVKRRKRRVYTTQSFHWLRKYPNHIRGFIPRASNQLWVSDITYWKTDAGYLYISLITDAYSRKIVGYQVAEILESIETLHALKMALENTKGPIGRLIHHSDRGIQYCSSVYVSLLKKHGIIISMTENGDPLENAIAERVNGIIKNEYLDGYEVNTLHVAKQLLDRVIEVYNDERPHMSLGNLTPNQVHENPSINVENIWKKRRTVNLIQDYRKL
ncbi:MAG: IS3 family transposase [Cytophagales bacterium]|nr:IS3 family transposase [Cytophagales bacterium]